MSEFHSIATAVEHRLRQLTEKAAKEGRDVYAAKITGDELNALYLTSFPEGTNPIFRVRTEHDCACCRNFIKNLGRVLVIEGEELKSVWGEMDHLPHPYNVVAAALNKAVIEAGVLNILRTKETSFGKDFTFEDMEGRSHRWNHFHGKTPVKCITKEAGTEIGRFNGDLQVYRRGLEEISIQVIDDVIGQIEQANLYRGDEFLPKLKQFRELKTGYDRAANKVTYTLRTLGKPGYRIRNEVIGTLLDDLVSGKNLEAAMRIWESKMAPANYKRPKAIVSQRMLDEAVAKLRELGLEDSLQRRHALMSDIQVNNVLWADPSKRTQMKASLLDSLAPTLVGRKKESPVKGISAEEFFRDIMPQATKLEIMFAGGLVNNLMTLTTAAYPDAPGLFKWNNHMAWSYNGDITDSIKERVKKAGGNITGQLRVSLSWDNKDDLDLYVSKKANGHGGYSKQIYFHNRRDFGAFLDVDANGIDGLREDPVENVAWVNAPEPGQYTVTVNQYSKRSTSNVGFTLEIESKGKIIQISHPSDLRGQIQVANIVVDAQGNVEVVPIAHKDLSCSGISREQWGISTEQYVQVSTVMNSPNFWDGQSNGNLHTFFIVEGCKNPDPVRGIFNEYLRNDLEEHRRFLEMLGNKSKVEFSDQQLSGLGFSSTRNDLVQLRVTRGTRVEEFNVQF